MIRIIAETGSFYGLKNVKKRGLDGFGLRSVRECRVKVGSGVFISRVSPLKNNGASFSFKSLIDA